MLLYLRNHSNIWKCISLDVIEKRTALTAMNYDDEWNKHIWEWYVITHIFLPSARRTPCSNIKHAAEWRDEIYTYTAIYCTMYLRQRVHSAQQPLPSSKDYNIKDAYTARAHGQIWIWTLKCIEEESHFNPFHVSEHTASWQFAIQVALKCSKLNRIHMWSALHEPMYSWRRVVLLLLQMAIASSPRRVRFDATVFISQNAEQCFEWKKNKQTENCTITPKTEKQQQHCFYRIYLIIALYGHIIFSSSFYCCIAVLRSEHERVHDFCSLLTNKWPNVGNKIIILMSNMKKLGWRGMKGNEMKWEFM